MQTDQLSILYLGKSEPASTDCHRALALRRLGHRVETVDPIKLLPSTNAWLNWLDYRTSYRRLQTHLLKALQSAPDIQNAAPDLIWINDGAYFGAKIVQWLKTHFAKPCVLYNNDDPTGSRDWPRYSLLRQALPEYDLCICCREVNELEWLALGAKNVLRVWMNCDEVFHLKEGEAAALSQPSTSSVCFIGTNIPGEKRDLFLLSLVQQGIPFSFYGDRWQRSRVWRFLKPHFKGPSLAGSAYTAALQAACLSLGLLSHGNRDLHTRRSMEAPAASTVLLAERTSEHKLLYEEGMEALFWQTPQECVHIATQILADENQLASVRQAGHQRVKELGVGNEDICRHVLAALATLTA